MCVHVPSIVMYGSARVSPFMPYTVTRSVEEALLNPLTSLLVYDPTGALLTIAIFKIQNNSAVLVTHDESERNQGVEPRKDALPQIIPIAS